jgi:hypothetical protein
MKTSSHEGSLKFEPAYLSKSGPISSHRRSFSFLSPYPLLPLCSFVSPTRVKTSMKARWVLGCVMDELLHGAGRHVVPTPHHP